MKTLHPAHPLQHRQKQWESYNASGAAHILLQKEESPVAPHGPAHSHMLLLA